MKRTVVFLSIACLTALTGCATTEPKIDIRYKNVLIEPSDELIQDCPVAEPPSREEYIAATPEKREELLTKAYASATVNATACNKRLKGLREWKAEQRKIFATPETAAAEKK
jgi:hypothetical protein